MDLNRGLFGEGEMPKCLIINNIAQPETKTKRARAHTPDDVNGWCMCTRAPNTHGHGPPTPRAQARARAVTDVIPHT